MKRIARSSGVLGTLPPEYSHRYTCPCSGALRPCRVSASLDWSVLETSRWHSEDLPLRQTNGVFRLHQCRYHVNGNLTSKAGNGMTHLADQKFTGATHPVPARCYSPDLGNVTISRNSNPV